MAYQLFIGLSHNPTKLVINDEKKESFTIKEFDSVVCGLSNKEELAKYLYDKGIIKFSTITLPLNLKHKYKEKMLKDEIIYDDELLRYYATTSKNKTKLEVTSNLTEFIEYIKSIALHETTSNYLLAPQQENNLSFEDCLLLDSILKGNNYSLDIRSLLNQYKHYINSMNQYPDEQLEIYNEINSVNQQIRRYFTDSYLNLRKMIIWEKRYQEILKRNLQNTSDEVKKIMFTSQLKQIEIEKDYRNGISDKRDSIDVLTYEEAEEEYYLNHYNYIEPLDIINPKMKELYEWGGVDAVRQYMDLDEIYAYGDEDAKAIGLLPLDNHNLPNSKGTKK